ncbi:zinc ribbon domain-containing protein [Dethiosulfatarculus sandiegensis]|uniref:Zinc-ribbon 15 domain-containing protein n=1 Tax=Dethiosulfatarculus sandiegensis TaxID=1429043 RepID=A0A0D2GEZ5_9BACT|nr:zinc ribbon domain-containing protein [Dethiosulfatarculus sandiegensis]KIX13487.1 hypothetical protein X474_13460 [Dethiosulfatarculus sandiegensis]
MSLLGTSTVKRQGLKRPGARVFIFIGGVQPKKTKLDDNPRTCPVCGLPSARLKRLDNYLSLFFIPVIPLKKGDVFLECERCGGVFSPDGERLGARPGQGGLPKCPNCGTSLQNEFEYCPKCGRKV